MREHDSENRMDEPKVRQFDTGATRNDDTEQLDYEGFISPLMVKRFAEYMHKHRIQSDGTKRASDNWQKGMPTNSYAKSLVRHTVDFWLCHRGEGQAAREDIEDALCAIIFNAQGYLHERLTDRENT